MGKIAFIFPGQASQYVGMGADLYQTFPFARDFYTRANEILGFNLTQISFEGPEEELKQTRYTQPAIFVLSVLLNRLLIERGVKPQMVAGHSLGEYSAMVAAEAFNFEAALQIVKLRGELMQQAGEQNPGMMAAIIGLTEDDVDDICSEARLESHVQAANYNASTQIVISGTHAGVNRAMALAQQRGAQKIVPLATSGAFHSNLMSSVKDTLKGALDTLEIKIPTIPVYNNVTAEPITSPAHIHMALFKQVNHPVRWAQSIANMVGDGAETFYEVGPGRVLSGMMKREYRSVTVIPVGKLEDLNAIG